MSFLYRKTDFYRTLTEESQVGFPPGVPENMLRCYFSKYNQLTKNEERKVERSKITPENTKPKAPEVAAKPSTETPPKSKPSPQPSPLLAKTQDEWQKNSESHNGAVRYVAYN